MVARDPLANGRFVYAVRSTGIYCRPGCASRLPKRANARFFDGPAQAEGAGFRACRRCLPNQPMVKDPAISKLIAACRLMEKYQAMPTLAEIAHHACLSASHLHRLFRSHLGVTPKEYGLALRGERLKRLLMSGKSTTDAIYSAGYGSSGRCYSDAAATLGMTPGQYRAKGRQTQIRFAIADCSLGRLLVGMTDKGVCRMAFGDTDEDLVFELTAAFPEAEAVEPDRAFARCLKRVIKCVENPATTAEFPLDIRGTVFQHAVWKALLAIAPGPTRGYREVILTSARAR